MRRIDSPGAIGQDVTRARSFFIQMIFLVAWALQPGCEAPVLVRNTRLQTYWALGLLPQSGLLADRLIVTLSAPESAAMPDSYLEQTLIEELEHPWWPDVAYKVQLDIAAIRIATRYRLGLTDTVPSAFTPERPLIYFDRANDRLAAFASPLRVRLYHAYALFCFANLEYGKAQGLLQTAATWAAELSDESLLRALVADAQATVASIMGRSEEAKKFRPKLASEGAAESDPEALLAPLPTYFRRRARSIGEWYEYSQLLLSAMDQAVNDTKAASNTPDRDHSVHEMWRAWRLAKSVIDQQLPAPLQYVGTFRAAELLAQNGEGSQAVKLLHDWPELRWQETKHEYLSKSEATLWTCSLGSVHLNRGSPGDALSHLEDCQVHRPSSYLTLEQDLALAHERQGDLLKAMAHYQSSREFFEEIRNSFKAYPQSRAGLAKFFNSSFLRSYHAVLRLQLPDKPVSDRSTIEQLVAATEAVRARQFRDQLAEEQRQASQKPETASLALLQERLAKDEVLLSYVATDVELVLVCITKATATAQKIAISRTELEKRVTQVAYQLATPALQEGTNALLKDLQELSQWLLPPELYRQSIAHKARIIVVPDEVISAVPFDLLSRPGLDYHSLFSDQKQLLITPSLSLFLAADWPMKRPFRVLGLADPPIPTVLNERVSPLPETRAEILDALNQPKPGTSCPELGHCILFGEAARGKFLREHDLSNYSVFHAATHGFLGETAEPKVFEPALLVAAEPGEPPQASFLTISQVEGLRLHADLVILSACHSGQGPSVAGEGVLGLGRAFLRHSRAVLMTLWAVDSKATKELVIRFYAHLKDTDRSPRQLARALWQAKQDYVLAHEQKLGNKKLCRSVKVRSERLPPAGQSSAGREGLCIHPFFWAPFVLLSR